MAIIANDRFIVRINERGYVDRLTLTEDGERMNWVVDPDYLETRGYPDTDKLFGRFSLQVNGVWHTDADAPPRVAAADPQRVELLYPFRGFAVRMIYDAATAGSAGWRIVLENGSREPLLIGDFFVWASLAYVMFQDSDVRRNMDHSCAVFPSLSPHFSKLACVRRSNRAPHLGLYAEAGETASLGTFCRFENNFFKNVSPSLDGLLFHQLVLIGSGTDDPAVPAADWIYGRAAAVTLAPGEARAWAYRFMPFQTQEQFYENAMQLGHPRVAFPPFTPLGGRFEAEIRTGGEAVRVELEQLDGGVPVRRDVTGLLKGGGGAWTLPLRMEQPGEKKLSIAMADGRTDLIVFNVMEPLRNVIEARVDYICRALYVEDGVDGAGRSAHAFLPLSNQGESLGKAALVLMKNRLGEADVGQVRKVENSAVHYIRTKWFEDGDWHRPAKLYGEFYRIIDLDYAAHVFYLLSTFGKELLAHHAPEAYLAWAAETMIVRLDPSVHAEERERKETEMLGVYVLFIRELLDDLLRAGLAEQHGRLDALWRSTTARLRRESASYAGAVTEHFFDNAGFGPTCEALCRAGYPEEAERYGELLLANIGFGNDFRAQSPDRWWESLSYMTHSLWGGLAAASTLVGYEHFRRPAYLEAAYRATVAVFYCYDWHAGATERKLRQGEAASTYSIAGPNLNRPDLSRNRFGQSVFTEADGEIFKGLFQEDAGYDWDMGEELVAYLAGFGTKTFLYYADGEIRCVNGELVRDGDGYEVTSYAAYPQAFYFYDENAAIRAMPGEELRTVRFADGAFRRVGE